MNRYSVGDDLGSVGNGNNQMSEFLLTLPDMDGKNIFGGCPVQVSWQTKRIQGGVVWRDRVWRQMTVMMMMYHHNLEYSHREKQWVVEPVTHLWTGCVCVCVCGFWVPSLYKLLFYFFVVDTDLFLWVHIWFVDPHDCFHVKDRSETFKVNMIESIEITVFLRIKVAEHAFSTGHTVSTLLSMRFSCDVSR